MSDRPKPIKGFYKPELFIDACEDWLRYLHDGDGGQKPNCDISDKYEHAVLEIALEMIYGPEFWDYYNELTKDFYGNETKLRIIPRLHCQNSCGAVSVSGGGESVSYLDLVENYGFRLEQTCWACPEQYDLFDSNGNYIAYFRLRHGVFTVEDGDMEKLILTEYPNGDGMFEDDERDHYMSLAIEKVKEWIDKNGVTA